MSTRLRPIEIVGGGLAGLSLGMALRRAGVPVTVFEAGGYPRHRVCGEFITGLGSRTVEALGLETSLAPARRHHRVAWFRHGRMVRRQELPEPALAVSRYDLDAALAREFVRLGGELRTGERVSCEPRPGRVNAAGRCRGRSAWIGLKQHVRGLPLASGLELHLGQDAYVGLCELPNGVVNVCGLFRGPLPGGANALSRVLRARGFLALADRIAAAQPDRSSRAAVAGFEFDSPSRPPGVRIGDALRVLPPFLGNGMAAAFQMAEDAVEPLLGWSRDELGWMEAWAGIDARMRVRLRRRARWGGALQGFLLGPRRQGWFAALAGARCVPLNTLYRILH